MKHRIRTTSQARRARERAIDHLQTRHLVEIGTLTEYTYTLKTPRGSTWTRTWRHR